jgi:hypothetical protein
LNPPSFNSPVISASTMGFAGAGILAPAVLLVGAERHAHLKRFTSTFSCP